MSGAAATLIASGLSFAVLLGYAVCIAASLRRARSVRRRDAGHTAPGSPLRAPLAEPKPLARSKALKP